MRDDKEFEAFLRAALSRKGAPAPFSIDVTQRVMTRVAELGPPPVAEMTRRQLGRWATAASVAGVALILAAASQAPSLGAALSFALHTLADGTGAALKLTGPVSSLAGALGRVAIALVRSAQTLVSPLIPLQPLAQLGLAAIAAAMLSITTFVLARDLAGRVTHKERA